MCVDWCLLFIVLFACVLLVVCRVLSVACRLFVGGLVVAVLRCCWLFVVCRSVLLIVVVCCSFGVVCCPMIVLDCRWLLFAFFGYRYRS